MSKRYTKKKGKSKKGLRKHRNTRKTRSSTYGGDPNPAIREEQMKKKIFRRTFNNLILQIANKKNVNQAINSIVKHFDKNSMINTLIPVSATGKPVDIDTYTDKTPIVDFVSPVTVIFDNVSGIAKEKELIKLLNAYFTNGGNFNNVSNRFKVAPFEHEVNKKRKNNVKILLDHSNPFHIIEDGLDNDVKLKLSELIPREQKIDSKIKPISEPMPEPIPEPIAEPIAEPVPNLQLLYPLPENSTIGYDRNVAPDFWKPMFEDGKELIELREKFMGIYEFDKYTENVEKRFKICDILETLFPGYLTKYTLSFGETAKTLVTVNILNCLITLLYGILTYKLYEFKQDYLLLFKGGRALQLSLNDIPNVTKYFSEDTDILIIPNKTTDATYNLEKMKNLSCHIAYLIKWFIPEEIHIVINLPMDDSTDITKIVYNDEKLYKALSDIGFGEIKEDVKQYFENPLYFPFYVDSFETTSLFITPTIDDILVEKLYYYIKYSNAKQKLISKETIAIDGDKPLTEEAANYYMFKFNKAIKQIVNSILKRDYVNLGAPNKEKMTTVMLPEMIENFRTYSRQDKERIYNEINNASRQILRGIISEFHDYSTDEQERVLKELYP